MRIQLVFLMLVPLAAACVSAPLVGGPLGEGAADYPNITSVDSAFPPKNVSVRLDKDAYAVVILVAPGHSAVLLYPKDSTTDNRLAAGPHDIAFQIPRTLVLTDSAMKSRIAAQRARFDSGGRARASMSGPASSPMPPLLPDATTYLLVVTSPQQLAYSKVLDKTAGWSIPLEAMEALNAVAKQVKSTIANSPRDWSAAYHLIALAQPKKK